MKKIKDMKFLLLIITTLFLIIFNAKISYAYSSNEPSGTNNNVPVAGNPVVGQVYWKFDTDTLYLNNTQVDASYTLIDENQIKEENSTYIPWRMHKEDIVYVNIENIIKPTTLEQYFDDLNNLIEIYNISNLDTSNATNMERMFANCHKLTNIDLSNFDTSQVTNMQSMFRWCLKITNLNLSSFNTSKLTKMSSLFEGCYNLKYVNLSNFDTSNVTDMDRMFESCYRITTLDLSNFNTSKVKSMNYVFRDCWDLTYLDISNFDTSQVESMTAMFQKCTSLTALDVSSFDTSNVTYMAHMFDECLKLKSLDLSGFNTSKVTDMSSMFRGCSGLIQLDVSNFNTSKVEYMTNMFYKCEGLKTLNLSSFDTSSVIVMMQMFSGCRNITKLNLTNFNTSKVIDMGDMFANCINLTKLDLSNFDTSQVIDMRYMFSNCSNLKILDLKNFITPNIKDVQYMFSGCSSLIKLDISNLDISEVIYYDNFLNGATSLLQLETPKAIVTGIKLPKKLVDQNNTTQVYSYMPTTSKTLIPFETAYLLNVSDTMINFRKALDGNYEHGQIFKFRVYKEDGTPTNIEVENNIHGDILVETKNLDYGRYYIKEETKSTSTMSVDKSRYYFEIKKEEEIITGTELTIGPAYYSFIESDFLNNQLVIKQFGLTAVDNDGNNIKNIRTYNSFAGKTNFAGNLGKAYINPTEEEINKARGVVYDGPHKGELADVLRMIMFFETEETKQNKIWDLLSYNETIDLSKYTEIPNNYEYAIVEPLDFIYNAPLIDLKTTKYEVYENGVPVGKKEYRKLIVEQPMGFFNNRTNTPEYEIKIEKKDMFGNMLEGATFKITKIDGTILDLWVTTKEIKTIKLIDGEYIIKEVKSPDGYEINNKEIKFKIENGKVIEVDKDNNYIIKDNIITITNIQKTEENPNTGSFIFKDIIMLGALALIIGGLYLLNKKNIFVK